MQSNEGIRPGARLGPYEIVAPLGAGGMGEVWRARDPRLERDVALKVLPAELAGEAERLARFEREAKALAALNHPHIVTIHSVEEADGVRFLTMELVEGETLDRLIPPGGMALERFLDVGIPLADALAAAHGRGVLHRDLKPANVMVTEEGRVKVLDFGLAKLAGEPVGDLTEVPTGSLEELTREGRIVGTAPYMSPEQVQGRAADVRSDIFSLGVVLYEMVTGRRPFAGESAAALVSSILRDEPASTSDLRPELPRQLGRILRHCLAKDPERRFQSAKDLRNELEELRQEVRDEASTPRVMEAMEGEARRQVPPSRPKRVAAPALVVVVLVVAGLVWLRSGEPPDPDGPPGAELAYARTALAVLPFQNLSADPEHAYFAGGLHDELLAQLSRVAAISLRGRTSVMGYAETTKPIRQIAEELQVGALVEGSVQVIDGRLRVIVQLIDAVTDEHLWADRYDRSLDDAFAIQSDVAQRVVAAVGASLGADEQRAIAAMPTADPEAYRLYLQGLDYHRRPGYLRQDLEIAQQLYERALELDPEFALAHAALSEVHGRMHWFRHDPSSERIEAQLEAAEAALRLAPELPQAYMAMGMWHYHGQRDWLAALEQFEIASRKLPNDPWLVALIGYVNRRMGNWDTVYEAFERATELDPRHVEILDDLGGRTYGTTRRYPEAIRAFDRALELAPDFHGAAYRRAWTYLWWKGELGELRAVLEEIPYDSPRAHLLLLERDGVGLLQHLDNVQPDVLEDQLNYSPKSLYEAWAHQLRGDDSAARRAFVAALDHLEEVPDSLRNDWRVRTAGGLALAGLGRREEALEETRWLEQTPIYREDAFWRPLLAENRARILAQAGEADAALDEIERLLAGPARLSVHTLRLDPRWDPIRDHPRFRELLEKYS